MRERGAVKAVQVNRSENVSNMRRGNVKLSQKLYLAPGHFRIHPQLMGHGDEIFLQYLHGNHAATRPPMLSYQINCALLLRSRELVVGIDQNVGIEKAANAHMVRRSTSALMDFVAIKTPTARIALPRKPLELFNTLFRIIPARELL